MKTLILVLLLFLCSCGATKQLAAPPTQLRVTTITTYVHDTVLVIKGDTVRTTAALKVDSKGKITINKPSNIGSNTQYPTNLTKANGGLTTQRAKEPIIHIDSNNTLHVACNCDSAAIKFTYTQTTKSDSTTVIVPPIVTIKALTTWQLIQLWAGRLLLLLLLAYTTLFILKKLKYI